MLDGARYATPYNFVRALKRRAIKVSGPRRSDAVQLLTVHGAKGLEAKVVFVMDADPQPKNAEVATLLIDWPVDDARPRRCAFVYAESACPPSLMPLLATEVRARRREELNGLYVAMSRAKQRLIFSATEPSYAAPGLSWWERIAPMARPWVMSDLPISAESADAVVTIKGLPLLPPRLPAAARVAVEDTEATRLGKAVHRVLEWAAGSGSIDATELAQSAAAEFGAAPETTAQITRAILGSPSCSPFFAGPSLRWAGNEVPISIDGEVLRIDRLVQLGDAWWVLDYKLHHAPHELESYREQLHRYREAVRRLQPGADVRCAFITGAGNLIEID